MQSNRFQLWYAAQPQALRILLTINVVVYLAWNLVLIHIGAARGFVLDHVALNPFWPDILFEPWQLLTYGFLHLSPGLGGLLHIGFNMLWMLWIGRDYEELYGPGRILGVYLLGAAGGALLTVALHALFPGVNAFGGVVHGASGAVLALMTMVAIHQPDKQIGLMFIGVVRLIHVVIGFIALDFLFLSAGGTSVSAHLGGVATGFLLGRVARSGQHPTPWADWFFGLGGGSRGSYSTGSGSGGSMLDRLEARLARRKEESEGKGGARVYQMPSRADSRSGSDFGSHDDSSAAEIDRILDKISAKGYDSLTEAEKRKLIDSSGDA
ncbi:MAG: rhomboid family intramembrane serine protease [Bacteroidota bacterium]|nr:rhomboid family intramembrane serine protease [Bacteroidota bacterium]